MTKVVDLLIGVSMSNVELITLRTINRTSVQIKIDYRGREKKNTDWSSRNSLRSAESRRKHAD